MGQPIARIQNAGGSDVSYLYHSTLQHLVVSLRDTEEMDAGFVYGPFGEVLEELGSADDFLRRFNDKYFDSASSLSYYGVRYYDPLSLTWTQADPMYRFAPDAAWDGSATEFPAPPATTGRERRRALGRGAILIRRSETRGSTMNKTKTGKRQKLYLPEEVMAVLEWHVERLAPGAQEQSDLPFPSLTGGFRSGSVLTKPFAKACRALRLPYTVTAKAMRRTLQDMARHANVPDTALRSISGHSTPTMTRH